MAQAVLETPRLVLRPFQASDNLALHAFFSDPEATRYWGDAYESLSQTDAFIRQTMEARDEEACDFVITRGGRVVGKAGMWRLGEIGFFILPEAQRQGIAKEALSAIIPHLFETYGIEKLTADVDPRNRASIGLLESLGFRETHREENTMQIGGAWCDSIYLALRRPLVS